LLSEEIDVRAIDLHRHPRIPGSGTLREVEPDIPGCSIEERREVPRRRARIQGQEVPIQLTSHPGFARQGRNHAQDIRREVVDVSVVPGADEELIPALAVAVDRRRQAIIDDSTARYGAARLEYLDQLVSDDGELSAVLTEVGPATTCCHGLKNCPDEEL
jgi:hypothetical protein